MDTPKSLSLGGSAVGERPLVAINEKTFRVRAVTRSVQIELNKLDRDLRALGDDTDDPDELVTYYGRGMDLLLQPEGHRTPVSKLVQREWEADRLSVKEIEQFTAGIQEIAAADRPT